MQGNKAKNIAIDDLLGVPYVLGGRDVKNGLDCYGLTIEIERRLGTPVFDAETVGKRGFSSCIKENLNKGCVIKVDVPSEIGDILVFEDDRGVCKHTGVYLGGGRVIHCNEEGVHIEPIGYVGFPNWRVYRCTR